MTDEQILDQLQSKLVEGAKHARFELASILTSPSSRMFLAYAGNRCTKVLLSVTVPEMVADIALDRGSLTLSSAQIGDEILKLLQR